MSAKRAVAHMDMLTPLGLQLQGVRDSRLPYDQHARNGTLDTAVRNDVEPPIMPEPDQDDDNLSTDIAVPPDGDTAVGKPTKEKFSQFSLIDMALNTTARQCAMTLAVESTKAILDLNSTADERKKSEEKIVWAAGGLCAVGVVHGIRWLKRLVGAVACIVVLLIAVAAIMVTINK